MRNKITNNFGSSNFDPHTAIRPLQQSIPYHAYLQKALFKSPGLHVQMDHVDRISILAVKLLDIRFLTLTWSIIECSDV